MIPIDEVIIFDVVTHVPSTAAVSDADSAPTFDVFEEDTDTPILAAQAMTKRTSKTGNYRGSITCSAANGFEAGKWYSVVVTAIVSSITAKCVAKHFRVAPVELVAGVPKVDVADWLGTAPSTPTVAGVPNVNAKTWNDLATVALPLVPTTAGRTLDVTAANKVNGVVLVDTLTTYTGNTPQTGDSYARLGAPAGASVSADLAADKAVDDAIKAKTDLIPASPASTTNITAGTMTTTTNLTNAPPDSSGVTTLLSRLSALRAGYLDNLSAGAHALEASLQTLITTVGSAGAGLTATATAVWAVATRLLTAGTNIALAKGVGVTGFNDLDAAGVRTAVGLASANLDTQLDALPTNAELATALGTADDATLAAIAALNNLSIANVRTAVGLASANLDTQLGTIAGYIDTEVGTLITNVATILAAVDTEVAAIKAKTDNLPSDPADQSAVEAAILAAWTTALTESYNADGAAPTPAQALFLILQRLTEFAIVGTAINIKKLDGSTTAVVLTIDDATSPTSSTRSA